MQNDLYHKPAFAQILISAPGPRCDALHPPVPVGWCHGDTDTSLPVTSTRSLGVLALLVTALGWGLGWLAMKVVLQTWTPLFARGLAGVIAAVLLAARRSSSCER